MPDEEKDGTVEVSAETPAADAVAEAPKNPNMRWYIIHSYSGFERKVKESLESRVQAFGLRQNLVERALDRLGRAFQRRVQLVESGRIVRPNP